MVLALMLTLTLMPILKKILMSKAVWKILDGVGDAVDGTVEEISAFLFERLNKQAEGGEVIINNVLLLNHYMKYIYSSYVNIVCIVSSICPMYIFYYILCQPHLYC